jgi:4'-phosphopantetheinyl transferase
MPLASRCDGEVPLDTIRTDGNAVVEVWVLRLLPDYRIDERQVEWLDDVERNRAASFYAAQDRDLYVAAHIWLRRILGMALAVRPREVVFTRDTQGKPAVQTSIGAVAPSPIKFSLSHTTSGIACAISSECPVGVDIECIVPIPNLLGVAAYSLHAAELDRFSTAEDYEQLSQFYRLWTAKESLLKAIGTGLDCPPSSLAFADSCDGSLHLSAYPESRIGPLRSVTYVGRVRNRPELGRREHIFAVSALAPAAGLMVHEILCGACTDDSHIDRSRSFNVTLGGASDVSPH